MSQSTISNLSNQWIQIFSPCWKKEKSEKTEKKKINDTPKKEGKKVTAEIPKPEKKINDTPKKNTKASEQAQETPKADKNEKESSKNQKNKEPPKKKMENKNSNQKADLKKNGILITQLPINIKEEWI